MKPLSRAFFPFLLSTALTLAGGCSLFLGSPNASNVELRKKVQQLQEQVGDLEKRREADVTLIRALRQALPTATRPALAPDRLDRLFTAHGLKFGKLTGAFDPGPSRTDENGVKVYVVPTDQEGQPLKAAGSFTIEAFDLSEPQAPLVGRWAFDTEQAKKNWYGGFFDYTYAFTLPWKTWARRPMHGQVTVKVAFADELTGATFESQTVVKIPPPATQPGR